MSKFIQRLAFACALAAGCLIVIVVALTVINTAGFMANAATRVFGQNVPGLPGYEDAVSLLIGCAALFMLPYCQLSRGHVSVDLFTSWMSPRLQGWLLRLTDLAMALCAGFLAYMLTRGMLIYKQDQALSPVLGWPIWPFMLPGVFALALWAAIALFMAFHPALAIGEEEAEPDGDSHIAVAKANERV